MAMLPLQKRKTCIVNKQGKLWVYKKRVRFELFSFSWYADLVWKLTGGFGKVLSEEGNYEPGLKCLVRTNINYETYTTVQSLLPQCLLFIDINNSLFNILKPTSFSNASILNLNYQLWWEIFGFNLWWIVLPPKIFGNFWT